MPVRIGLVGLGAMGGAHLSALREIPGAQVTAVCDRDPSRLADGGSVQGNIDAGARPTRLDGIQTYHAFARMLREAPLDAVDICTPTYLHAGMAIQALKAGKHVFCEKPLALRPADARRAARTAHQEDRFLMVGHVLRFWPEYLMLKDMLDGGRHGSLLSADFWRHGAVPRWGHGGWFQDSALSGGAAMDLHVHDTDVVLWFFGVPLAVRSQRAVTGDGVEYVWTGFQYDTQAVIRSHGGWLPGPLPFAMGARLVFESACAEYDSSRQPTLTVYPRGGTPQRPEVPAVQAYREELRHFLSCVESGRPPQRAGGDEAALAVEVVHAELRSARTGRAVAIR